MKESKTNGQIHKTKNYSQFKLLGCNRTIIKRHIEELVESISNSNDLHLNPIIVTSDMEVVDGQHRLKAAEKLGVEIYYVIDNDFNDNKIITLNTKQKTWKLDDFLHYWVEHGKEDYIKLDEFIKDMGFPTPIILRWLSNIGGRDYEVFKKGAYKFKLDEEILNKMLLAKKIIEYMKVKRIRQNSIARQAALHVAIRSFLLNPLIDQDRFMEKLEQIPYEIKYSYSWQAYFEQFLDIYNYKVRDTNRVKLVSKGDDRELIA